jgi:hypothetical protein
MPVSDNEGFDFLGNTVAVNVVNVVNVVEAVAGRLAAAYVASAPLVFKKYRHKCLFVAA